MAFCDEKLSACKLPIRVMSYSVYKVWIIKMKLHVYYQVHLLIQCIWIFLQFMSITYILQIAWLLMLCFLVIVTLIFTIFWSLCSNTDVQNNNKCIDFRQFGECFNILHLLSYFCIAKELYLLPFLDKIQL
jgi:hypothetical protein